MFLNLFFNGEMMAFLNEAELRDVGFKHIGLNVKISDKAVIYNPEKIIVNDNSRVDDFCVISGRVEIGRNVHITISCNIAGGAPGVYIGDFSTIAYGCHVMSQSDDYSGMTMTNSTVPKQYKNETFKAVHIGQHVIIGACSVVLPGCDISDGCSIGAMSLVNKPTVPWGIYVGSPARRIKNRSKDLLNFFSEFMKNEKNDSI